MHITPIPAHYCHRAVQLIYHALRVFHRVETDLENEGVVQMEPEAKAKGSSIASSVFNLTNTIIGAGALCW